MKETTIITYNKDDIDELQFMSDDEIINVLNHIGRGWLPQDYVYSPEDCKEYSESQYDTTRLHVAIDKAIEIIERNKNMNTLL